MRTFAAKLAMTALLSAVVAIPLSLPAAAQDRPPTPIPKAGPDHWTIVHAGTLLADAGKPAQTNVSVIIKNKTVSEIRPGSATAADLKDVPADSVKVIELGDKFVMPGIIDAHVHITSGFGTGRETPSQHALDGVVNARNTLLGGMTTVRDVGAEPDAIFPLRDAINAGMIMGPRILAAGPLIAPTGGHGDPRNHQPDDITFDEKEAGTCDGVDECRKLVRRLVQLGADLIKIASSDGLGDKGFSDQSFTEDEDRAIVETAHQLDRKVADHAEFNKGIGAGIRAGIDSLEHGNAIDADQIAMAKAKGIYLVPTMIAWEIVSAKKLQPGMPRDAGLRKVFGDDPNPDLGRHLKAAYKAGMKIAMGTDTSGTNAGKNAHELELMVKWGGMTPIDTIRAATLGGADLLGLSDQVGSIAPGKEADMVAMDKSPIDDISQVTHITFVMRNGTEYKGPGVQPPLE